MYYKTPTGEGDEPSSTTSGKDHQTSSEGEQTRKPFTLILYSDQGVGTVKGACNVKVGRGGR